MKVDALFARIRKLDLADRAQGRAGWVWYTLIMTGDDLVEAKAHGANGRRLRVTKVSVWLACAVV